MRILVIEDDPVLCNLLKEFLVPEGFQVETVNDGASGLEHGLSGKYDFIILDLRLPRLNGFEILRRTREKSDIPILILTSCNAEADRIKGLVAGADDYLNKPFSLQELLARIRAIIRRTSKRSRVPNTDQLIVGDITLDPGSRRAYRDGEEILLTAAEYTLLEVLLSNAGQVVAREELVRRVQGRHHNPYDRSIDVHISRLRKKLSNYSDGSERIKAVRGVGHFYSLPTDKDKLSN